ncbi:MAG: tRNA preQ1(34) S-adenosylmethionine ribosyltransferase-isomerase QueA [Bdellovibrionaceae bacterium]|nr:tRNA preQ1(34) S-adenosylmethionine ribosyltransferase-isomerase QueA [Pseudobdellovibrionaceae bacterium]
MKANELSFDFPESLIATEPQSISRVLHVPFRGAPTEITLPRLLDLMSGGDVLVVNSTKVLKRRIFGRQPDGRELEILFLNKLDQANIESSASSSSSGFDPDLGWEVLFPTKGLKVGARIELPEGLHMSLTRKGRPQQVQVSAPLSEAFFLKHGELPLPPYIQKARGVRHTQTQDGKWYQTDWARDPGSLAAPTASLHFSESDLELLKRKDVRVVSLVLHVGLGTFLPVTVEDLNDHVMHEEYIEIPAETWQTILTAKQSKQKVWCMGTTVTRAVESAATGLLRESQGSYSGKSGLLIQPGFSWQITDCLLTNFHQPKSTLLALVAAFAGLERVQECYRWAIQRQFRLFSYGDLSVWERGQAQED